MYLLSTGVKDASDKKILVDMLFWAVDNPAPGNYLLISGDRDFSNALHQLRMRRYNILLAQPQRASAPLLAAARSVWLWTSLVAGGPPLPKGEALQLTSTSSSDTSQIPVPGVFPTEPNDPYMANTHLPTPKFTNGGRSMDIKQKGKPTRRSYSQGSGPKSINASMGMQDHSLNFPQPGNQNLTVPFSGTSVNFIPPGPDPSWNNQNQHLRPAMPNNRAMQPPPSAGNLYPTNPHIHSSLPFPMRPAGNGLTTSPLTNMPDIGKLGISNYPSGVHNTSMQQQNEEMKQETVNGSMHPGSLNGTANGHIAQNVPSSHNNTLNSRYSNGPECPPVPSPAGASANNPANGVWGSPGCPQPSEYVQGLIGVILLALNTLKNEKIMPTESNIADCIRYGDPKHRNTDVKKALESAIERQMVVRQNLGALQLYVAKNEKLWKCVNLLAGNPKQFPKPTWDEIKKFLKCPSGRSAIMTSQCR